MFHSCQYHTPVMSVFFRPHKPFEDITLDDVRLPFHPSRYLTDGDFDSDTRLMSTISIESDPSKSSYPTYSMGFYHLEPSQPSVIRLSSDSSTSSAGLVPPPVRSCGFIHIRTVPRWCELARGRGLGDDAPDGFENEYLPFDG